jgi:hypothetical protein
MSSLHPLNSATRASREPFDSHAALLRQPNIDCDVIKADGCEWDSSST